MSQLSFAEINPASPWCQRWNGGSHSWRHKSEGGFDPARYTVELIDDDSTAKDYVLTNHYSGSYCNARLRFGLFEAGELVGVLVFGVPMSDSVLTNVFPALEPNVQSAELSRLVLHDRVPANAETWFIGQAFNEAAARGVRGVVSFADPVQRAVAGKILFPGHIGIIYQAKGALFCGRSTARTHWMSAGGLTISPKAMDKIRRQDRGHRYAEQQLVDLGARPMRAGEKPNEWLAEALRSTCTPFRHRGCYRYAFAIGSTRKQRRSVEIALPGLPYPKSVDRSAA